MTDLGFDENDEEQDGNDSTNNEPAQATPDELRQVLFAQVNNQCNQPRPLVARTPCGGSSGGSNGGGAALSDMKLLMASMISCMQHEDVEQEE